MVRVTLAGAELAGLDIGLPAASIRILLPRSPSGEVVLPVWNGNEFLDEDGTRPVIRTLTPLGFDGQIARARRGDRAPRRRPTRRRGAAGLGPATAPPSRGQDAATRSTTRLHSFLLAGDESALPAIAMLLDCCRARRT